jgi:hypothetical protein
MATTGATLYVAQFSIAESALGLGATGFQRAGKDIQQELAMCQRYYEKSYGAGVAIGTNQEEGMAMVWTPNTGAASGNVIAIGGKFCNEKRANPTFNTYDYSGNSGKVGIRAANGTQTNNIAPASATAKIGGFYAYYAIGTSGGGLEFHWTADAGL